MKDSQIQIKKMIGTVATIANIDPIFGMKFKKNVSVEAKVKSRFKLLRIINEINAVKNDVKTWLQCSEYLTPLHRQ